MVILVTGDVFIYYIKWVLAKGQQKYVKEIRLSPDPVKKTVGEMEASDGGPVNIRGVLMVMMMVTVVMGMAGGMVVILVVVVVVVMMVMVVVVMVVMVMVCG